MVVFLLSSLKIAMDSLAKSILIGIAVLWASFSFLDFASGCCKYTVLRSESVWDGICVLSFLSSVLPGRSRKCFLSNVI